MTAFDWDAYNAEMDARMIATREAFARLHEVERQTDAVFAEMGREIGNALDNVRSMAVRQWIGGHR